MKNRYQLLTCLAMGSLLVPASQAQLPVSRQSGILPKAVTAGQTQPVSLPFTRQPADRGAVSVSGDTVTLTGLSEDLTGLAGTHSAIGKSAASEGEAFQISAFPSSNQFTANGNSFAVGSQVLIVPNYTLDTLFPAAEGLTKGGNPGAADKVYVKIGSALQGFFFDTDVNEWRSVNTADTANKGGTMIGINDGILFIANTSKTINLKGIVRSGDEIVNYGTGTNVLTLPYPENTTLDASGLEGQINVGANPGAADKIYLQVGTSLQGFFFDTDVNQWRSVNTTDTADKGSTPIAAGDGLLIIGNSAGNITFQEPLE